MIVLSQVSTQLVRHIWPSVEVFFQKVIDVEGASADITLAQIKEGMLVGRFSLLTYVNSGFLVGALAVQYRDRLVGKTAFIFSVGGSGISSVDAWDQTTKIFKSNGAVLSEAYMRPSRFRLCRKFGYKTKYHVATVEL